MLVAKNSLTLGSLPVDKEVDPIHYKHAKMLVDLYHSAADNMTTEMQQEYIGHLDARAFCKPTDSNLPKDHALCQSIAVTLEFTWPKWMILTTLYGLGHPDLAFMRMIVEKQCGPADDLALLVLKENGKTVQDSPKRRMDLIMDDFFGVANRQDNDGAVGSDKDCGSLPSTIDSISSDSLLDTWPAMHPTSIGSKEESLGSVGGCSSTLEAISQNPALFGAASILTQRHAPPTQGAPDTLSNPGLQAFVAKTVQNSLDLQNRRIEAIEKQTSSGASDSLVQRVEALEAIDHTGKINSLKKQVNALATRKDPEALVALEKMVSESYEPLVLRLDALEKNGDTGAKSIRMVKAHFNQMSILLETTTARLDEFSLNYSSQNQRLDTVEGHCKDIFALILRLRERLDKMNIRIDRLKGRMDRSRLC